MGIGVTIFVSSHLLAEIKKMCTHVGIISNGKLRFEGTIDEHSKSAQGCKIQLTFTSTLHYRFQSDIANN